MANKAAPIVNGDSYEIESTAAKIPVAALLTLAPIGGDRGVTKAGIVLDNHRETFRVMQNGQLVTYTASVYIQREPITEDEKKAVAETAAERDANAKKRQAEEDAKREREIQRAGELTRKAVLDTMGDIEKRKAEARRTLETLGA